MTKITLKTVSLALLFATSALTPVFAQTAPAPAAMAATAAKPDADMAEVLSVLAGLGGKPIARHGRQARQCIGLRPAAEWLSGGLPGANAGVRSGRLLADVQLGRHALRHERDESSDLRQGKST
jgi:hypothetical protein